MLDTLRDLWFRFIQPPKNLNYLAGLLGYTLVPLTLNQKEKMAISVGGRPYNAMALEAFSQYDLCAVVGVEDAFLKIIKPFKSRIESVDTLSIIKELEEIKVQVWTPKGFIMNPYFSEGLLGWYGNPQYFGVYVKPNFENDGTSLNHYISFLTGNPSSVKQEFHIPLGTNWYTTFNCTIRSPTTGVTVLSAIANYSEGGSKQIDLTVTVANSWQRKALAFDADKHLADIMFYHHGLYPQCDLSWVKLVF